MKIRTAMVGLGVAAAALGLASRAFASPCSGPPGVEGQTRWSEQSELTYTCEGGQWHEGPYGYGAQS